MRKLLIIFLALILVVAMPLSIQAQTPFAYADDKEEIPSISGTYEVEQIESSNIMYFDFSFSNENVLDNPSKISVSDKYIAILDGNDVHIFSNKGEHIRTVKSSNMFANDNFNDPRNIEVVGEFVYVLDYNGYDMENPTPIKAIEISSGMVYTTITNSSGSPSNEDIQSNTANSGGYIMDMGTDGSNLYILTGFYKYSTSIKKFSTGVTPVYSPSFNVGSAFDNYDSIAVSSTHILGYKESGTTSLVLYDFATSKSTTITSLPATTGIIDCAIDTSNIYLLTSEGIYSGKIGTAPQFELILNTAKANTPSSSSNVLNPLAIAPKSNGSSLFIIDGANAQAVKSFKFSSSGTSTSDLVIGSYSSDLGAFNTPTSIAYSDTDLYIADSLNNRVQIITKSGKVSSFQTIDEDGEQFSPISIGVDYFKNIYIASKNAVYKYSSTKELLETYEKYGNTSFDNITALYASPVSNEVYVIEESRICSLQDGQFKKLSIIEDSDRFDIDMRFERIIVPCGTNVVIYDLRTLSQIDIIEVYPKGAVAKDVKTDFDGNLYVLISNYDNCSIVKYLMNEDGEYDYNGRITLESELVFNQLALNQNAERLSLIADGEHRIFMIDNNIFDDLKMAHFNEIQIPIDILEKTQDQDVSIGQVLESGNKLIYPLNNSDPLYPKNFAVQSARKLSISDKVIIVGQTTDEKYYYVLSDNSAGFMDTSAITVGDQLTDLPFDYGVALHENTTVYKYPLTTLSGLTPVFSFDTLAKNYQLKIIDMSADYVSPTGLYWYRVSYEKSGDIYEGYIPRYNVAKDSGLYNPEFEYGQINSKLLVGQVELYADLGQTPLGISLADKTRVKIYESSGEYSFIQEVTESGEGAMGYVLRANLTTDAQTQSTTIAIILIAVLIVVVLILVAVKLLIRKNRF